MTLKNPASHTREILNNNPDPLLIYTIVLPGVILAESKSTGRGNSLWSFKLQEPYFDFSNEKS